MWQCTVQQNTIIWQCTVQQNNYMAMHGATKHNYMTMHGATKHNYMTMHGATKHNFLSSIISIFATLDTTLRIALYWSMILYAAVENPTRTAVSVTHAQD
jgi:hypothetical protein